MIDTRVQPDQTAERVHAFVAAHQAPLWRWLCALGCERSRAEEHCQDALLAGLHGGIDALPAAAARRWLRTAARNLFLMRLRAERRRPLRFDADLAEMAWQDAGGDDDDGSAALEALAACLQRTDARSRALLEERYRERRSRAAMAAAHGLGEAGVKMALRRARARLRRCIAERLHHREEP